MSGGFVMFFALSLTSSAFAEEPTAAALGFGTATKPPAAAPKDEGSEATELPVPNLSPGEEKAKASLKSVSGVVNVLRQGERVEAVMKNGDVYQLPRGSRQHEIFKAFRESENSGSSVSFTVDSRSNVIQSVGGSSGGGSNAGGKQK